MYIKTVFESSEDSKQLPKLRRDHWTLCRLCQHLGGSLNGLYLAFYIANFYFLWIHLVPILKKVQILF
jgi:hypothetical protein